MTTVLPHIKIAWGGSLGDPGMEVWTNSIGWMAKTDSNWTNIVNRGVSGTQDNISALSTAIGQWFQTPCSTETADTEKGAGINPQANLEWVKLNIIGANGKYLFASNTFFYPVAISGGGTMAGNSLYSPPWQMTTAITLRTTVSRGRGSKGRIYPPMAGAPDNRSNGPYSYPAVTQQMANGFAGLLDNINSGLYFSTSSGGYDTQIGAANALEGNCCIVSTSPTSGPHAGATPLLSPILTVEVDAVPDVQTRRVNRIPRRIGRNQTVTLNL